MTKEECLEQLKRTKSYYRKCDLKKCLKRLIKEEKNRRKQRMKIRITGYYDFTDRSDNCCENDRLSILYEVPKTWSKWTKEKKEQWLCKNAGKIDKHMQEAMCVITYIPDIEDIEEF